MTESDLRLGTFMSANLVGAYMSGVNAEGTDFRKANLDRAVFGDKGLKPANMKNANFAGASMTGASLIGVDLSLAQGLTQEQINLAVIDETTKLPNQIERLDPTLRA